MRLKVESGVGRHRTSRWSLFDPERMATPRGGDVALGVFEKLEQSYSFEAMPGLGLPSTIQTLDRGLEPRLPRRGKDGNHAK